MMTPHPEAAGPAPARELAPLRTAVRVAALVGLVSLVIEFGWPLSEGTLTALHVLDYAIAGTFLLDLAARFLLSADRVAFLRGHRLEAILAIALGVETVTLFALTGGTALLRLYLAGFQLYIVATLILAASQAQNRVLSRINPAVIPLGAFLLLILAGTALLMTPMMRAPGAAPWSLLDALFTSTSASCVTGLSVRDVGSELSFRGQLTLLVLIQIGGLGPLLITLFLCMLQSSRLHVRQLTLLRDLMGTPFLGNLGLFLKSVVALTLGLELAGAAMLFLLRSDSSGGERAWWAVFHSISAFCNAGFAFQPDSLEGFAVAPGICLTVAALVIAGGLGFPVLLDLIRCGMPRRFQAGLPPAASGTTARRLTLHSRIVLTGTGVLLFAGTALFWIAERNGALAALSASDALTASVFQSAMPRTAGFNSVPVAALGPETLLLTMALMVAGAGPASTGGGIKIASVALLWLTAFSVLRNREAPEAFRRRISPAAVRTAVAIVSLYAISAFGISAALATTQEGIPFQSLLFESISALSTVGLSTGITGRLDSTGRIILCIAMLIGRLGPLALVGSLVFRPPPLRYQYPEEPVTVS
ncbi:MAG: Trk family potassium uptake protein [Candidatus Brocadiae bacterium]|nr:Trk family potassium uptake protein [Candidatus Brocadiia bacterium]